MTNGDGPHLKRRIKDEYSRGVFKEYQIKKIF